MGFSVGIGIVTYNRRDLLARTLARVQSHTLAPDAALVVADDGSTDGTQALLRDQRIPVVTGVNRGIAWNKNRALFLLAQLLRCETIILLEDDAHPVRDGWEREWMDAVQRWGHVNYAGEWLRDGFASGAGTPSDPILSRQLTAQCSAYSNLSLAYVGYFHPAFRGYGHEHVEHTRRLIGIGCGGFVDAADAEGRVWYRLIGGGVTVMDSVSYINAEQVEANLQVARPLMGVIAYRAPWQDEAELRQFRHEMDAAMRDGAESFRLTSPAASSGYDSMGAFGRMFRSHGA